MNDLDPRVFIPPIRPDDAEDVRRRISGMSAREIRHLMETHSGDLRTYLSRAVADWGCAFDGPMIRLMSVRGVKMASFMANPNVGRREAREILSSIAFQVRLGTVEDYSDYLRAIWVAMRRTVLAPDSTLLRDLEAMAQEIGGLESEFEADVPGDVEVNVPGGFPALRIWIRRLREAYEEGSRNPTDFTQALMGTYVLGQRCQDIAYQDPAGTEIAQHLQTTPEDLWRLWESYPNNGLLRSAVLCSIAGIHDYASHDGLRAAMRERLRSAPEDDLVAEALATSPRKDDFAEAMSCLWSADLHRRRVLEDSRIGPEALSWLSREQLSELLLVPQFGIREKAIRALGLAQAVGGPPRESHERRP